jgi:hypothetical protein
MVRYGYNFDPSTMFQPQPLVKEGNTVLLWNALEIHRDGSVTSQDSNWDVEHELLGGYNLYHSMGSSFKAYQELGKLLWPQFPKGLKPIDHIDRDRTNDSWSNLRRCNPSLNNINQARATTKGYHHETRQWLEKTNGYRVNRGQAPLSIKPRGRFISRVVYKGRTHELGVHETAEEAHEHYLTAKEDFIQDTLRTIWCEFLFQ